VTDTARQIDAPVHILYRSRSEMTAGPSTRESVYLKKLHLQNINRQPDPHQSAVRTGEYTPPQN
jgi:hypothetical protein